VECDNTIQYNSFMDFSKIWGLEIWFDLFGIWYLGFGNLQPKIWDFDIGIWFGICSPLVQCTSTAIQSVRFSFRLGLRWFETVERIIKRFSVLQLQQSSFLTSNKFWLNHSRKVLVMRMAYKNSRFFTSAWLCSISHCASNCQVCTLPKQFHCLCLK